MLRKNMNGEIHKHILVVGSSCRRVTNKKNGHVFHHVVCLNCGRQTEMRSDNIRLQNNTCWYCAPRFGRKVGL
jgi:hypothetical protein